MTEYKSVDTVHGRFYLDGEPVTIQIKGSKIEKIIREKKCPGDVFVAPGLIDQQVNGYMGVDFGESFTQSDVDKATQGLWKTGVTSYLPTLITGDRKRLLSNFNLLTKKSSKSRLSIGGTLYFT
jgi:N-acetylglucosamine-6-phosphate deacetylase